MTVNFLLRLTFAVVGGGAGGGGTSHQGSSSIHCYI